MDYETLRPLSFGDKLTHLLFYASRWISRVNPRDNTRHVILSTTSTRPTDFAAQLNVSLANGWGIVRTVADMCMKQPEGKYILVKDPNKVRHHTFTSFLPLCFASVPCHIPDREMCRRRIMRRNVI